MSPEEVITREYVEQEIRSDQEIGPENMFRYNYKSLLTLTELNPNQLEDYLIHAKSLTKEQGVAEDPNYDAFTRRLTMIEQAVKNNKRWFATYGKTEES